MENYEELGFAFREMLKRIKAMRVRLKDLCAKMNNNVITGEQFWDMQLECEGLNASLEYVKPDVRRAVIMLKICLYKRKSENAEKIIEENDMSTAIVEYTPTRRGLDLNPAKAQICFVSPESGIIIHDLNNLALSVAEFLRSSNHLMVLLLNSIDCSEKVRKFTNWIKVNKKGIG